MNKQEEMMEEVIRELPQEEVKSVMDKVKAGLNRQQRRAFEKRLAVRRRKSKKGS